ncbi:hypothetical protein RintRC_4632 [Richelia intracellularis]|nr:hypothetical protein RintRC_4632 [Richelia intracellularis]
MDLQGKLTSRGIVLGIAKLKQDLYAQLRRSHLLENIGVENIYPTLSTVIDGFKEHDLR